MVASLFIYLVADLGRGFAIAKNMSERVAFPVYIIIGALHGFLYGTLYAPVQALMFGLDFKGMLAWIASGFYFDVVHCIGNFALGFLIIPLVEALRKAHKTCRG